MLAAPRRQPGAAPQAAGEVGRCSPACTRLRASGASAHGGGRSPVACKVYAHSGTRGARRHATLSGIWGGGRGMATRILLVDDDTKILGLLQRGLASEGFQVYTATHRQHTSHSLRF